MKKLLIPVLAFALICCVACRKPGDGRCQKKRDQKDTTSRVSSGRTINPDSTTPLGEEED